MSLVASPVSSFEAVSLNLQFTVDPSQTVCGGTAGALKLVAVGPESPAFNLWQMSLVPLGDVAQYHFDAAALQTQVSPGAPSKFTDATGRSFVGPSDSSLQAAAALLNPNESEGTWDFPYSAFHSGSSAATAYPGTMLLSLDVPVTGLPASDAQDYGKLLQFAAASGQIPGSGVGQLPAGFLPMTSANGLSPEAAYTISAAKAVAAQSGAVPPLIPPPPATTTTTSTAISTTTTTVPSQSPTTTTASTPSSVPSTLSTVANTLASSRGGGGSSEPASAGFGGSLSPGRSSPPRHTGPSSSQSSSSSDATSSTTTTSVTSATPAEATPIEAVAHTPSIGSGVAGLAFPIALGCGLVAAGSLLFVRRMTPRDPK